MKKTVLKIYIFTFIVAFFNVILLDRLYNRNINEVDFINIESPMEADKIAEFSITDKSIDEIKDYCMKNNLDFIKFFTSYMICNNYEVDSVSYDYNEEYYKDSDYAKSVESIYRAILSDIEYFPIPNSTNETSRNYWYCNSWKSERTYGGNRKHYGTDIMDSKNERGYFPIISMTDGYVEKIGWLELGGWRVGIRAEHGGYFYYAHLEKYADNLKQGKKIKAGDIIGYMGNSGYGEEGTYGKFDVHLHLGIALTVKDREDEFWINPYWILQYIEDTKVKVDY
ncbi:MAG: M23 family metallopeptidase [Vallitalea sp.]|nr:M23 family metallopeptidase [Vallitalea sp.]